MNLFELFVKIGVDDQASNKLSDLSSKLGSGLKTAAKIGTAAVGAAAAGITALTTAAVNNYAEYEQLVGGVDTLFKDASQKVQKYAADAYKTAGMSANDYMANATAFSASLISSLGGDTEKAAEYANRAMVSMSDNANKMGTSLDSIVQTYQSLSRGNMAMLDNLKLGYGGTKAELERLIKDAASYTDIQKEMGITVDASSMSFDNIVNAIAVVQGKLGIAGATALEAGTTIEGSVNSMKAAWQNLVVGIADDNANMDTLIANFVESVGVAGENVLPRVQQVLIGIGDLIANLAPVAVDAVSMLVDDVLPSVLEAGGSLLMAVGEGIASNFDYLLQTAFDLIGYLTDSLISGADGLIDGAVQIVESLAMWIEEYSDVLIEKALVLVMTLVEGIAQNLPQIVLAAAQIIGALATGVIEYLPELIKQVPTIISELVAGFSDALPDIVAVGEDIVRGLWEGIQNLGGWLGEKIGGFFDGVVDGAKDLLGIHSPSRVFAGIGENMALGVGAGWDAEYQNIKNGITSGLDFGTGSVDFKSSAMGAASRTTASAASFGGEIVVEAPVYVGGSVVARNQYRFNLAEAQRRGNNLVTA